jgi:subtilisin family serine protease
MIQRWVGISVGILFLIGAGFAGWAQSASSDWISNIDVSSLTPFTVTFQLANRGTTPLSNVTGRVVLTDQFGQTIQTLEVEPFSVAAGNVALESAVGRWSFQVTGVYLAEVSLDVGGGLISNSLAFRILPIRLPLAPPVSAFGEGLKTLYQQPVSWGILRISAPQAWEVTDGNPSVVVAVIDSGIDGTIPQIVESLWVNPGEIPDNGMDDDHNGYVDDIHGWDFRDNDNSSMAGTPIHWHGTFVAGIIAARPGEQPIVGVAPGVEIMDVRFLDSSNKFGSRDWDKFVDAINYAVDNGADIINLSIYANGRPPDTFAAAIHRAAQAGVILVGIAGNTERSGVLYPGKYEDVYAVAATTEDDLHSDFSSWGPEVAFSAPGSDITSFLPGGQTATRSGTSFAAPHVSGTLALILSEFPSLTSSQAIEILKNSVIDLGTRGEDPYFGLGLVDAYAAVEQ